MLRLRTAVLPLLLGAAVAHAGGVEWQGHLAWRTAADGTLGPVDPAELVRGKISRDLDYVSLSLSSVFLRNLPGFEEKDEVILGVEAEGVLPGGGTLKTVAGVRRCRGGDCLVRF